MRAQRDMATSRTSRNLRSTCATSKLITYDCKFLAKFASCRISASDQHRSQGDHTRSTNARHTQTNLANGRVSFAARAHTLTTTF